MNFVLEKALVMAEKASEDSFFAQKAIKADIELIESKIPSMRDQSDRDRARATIKTLQMKGRNYRKTKTTME